MSGVSGACRHAKTHPVAWGIKRLHHILRVVGIRLVAPTRALDIELAMRINRIVAPSEQTQHHVWIQVIHARCQLEAIVAETEGSRRNEFRALPLIRAIRDSQA